jgi:FixJ family two-component response regulator
MTNRPIIWIIDEDEAQLDTHYSVLSMVMPRMDVRKFPPPPKMSECLRILDEEGTACLLLDQRLKETGVADYTGIELAQYVNGINGRLPVFILTNFAEEWHEFEKDSDAVEDILDKAHVRPSSVGHKQMISKIYRRVNVYLKIRNEQAQRTDELIRKSFSGPLSEDEATELAGYEVERDKSRFLREMGRIKEFKELIKAHHDVMERVRRYRSE